MKNKDTEKDLDNGVYILGSNIKPKEHKQKSKSWIWILICLFILATTTLIVFHIFKSNEQENKSAKTIDARNIISAKNTTKNNGYIEVLEETVDDVSLLIYVPHNAFLMLTVEPPKTEDRSVIFVAYAADVRADNTQIVGDFVVSGKQLARGQRKKGFCAIIENKITIGCNDDTPLLSASIEKKGFFFRQYPLVVNGKAIENEPKGKSYRKALAVKNDQIIMVESRSRESFHDFAQSLADVGISDAIYLVSGNSFGWYYTESGKKNTFGVDNQDIPVKVSNCIVWRSK